MMGNLAYVKIEVGGIQKFICQTGKLKEMIGGSELVNALADSKDQTDSNALADSIYIRVRKQQKLNPVDAPGQGDNWVVEVQNSAGCLCLILPSEKTARDFLQAFSLVCLRDYPGLPLYGTQTPMRWERESYKEARREADSAIHRQRSMNPVPEGMPMLPIVQAARLDGMPAVDRDKDERISLTSRTRRDKDLREQSSRRLKALVPNPEGVKLIWKEDLQDMLGDEKSTVALIHMDGNDLGKRFLTELDAADQDSLENSIKRMRNLGEVVEDAGKKAFREAVTGVVRFELRQTPPTGGKVTVPLRPLVMGGDDFTIIVRADLALAFVHLFVKAFTRETAKIGSPLSLGVGMVVIPASYPFARAFTLVDGLLEKAKHLTLKDNPRPSSIDYLVLTEEVEDDISLIRERLYRGNDGALLTAKPLRLEDDTLRKFLFDAREVLEQLPRSAVRGAMNACRQGRDAAQKDWLKLKENIRRGLGGRENKRQMTLGQFDRLFPDGFFQKQGDQWCTLLGDYLEVQRLLPSEKKARTDMLEYLLEWEMSHD